MPVIDYMARVLGWSEQQTHEYTKELDEELVSATQPAASDRSAPAPIPQNPSTTKLSS